MKLLPSYNFINYKYFTISVHILVLKFLDDRVHWSKNRPMPDACCQKALSQRWERWERWESERQRRRGQSPLTHLLTLYKK